MDQDIRWKQRFQNFEAAYLLLAEALADGDEELSDLEKEGVVQRFEYTYDQSGFNAAITAIANEYLPAIGELFRRLKEEV